MKPMRRRRPSTPDVETGSTTALAARRRSRPARPTRGRDFEAG